MKFLSLWLLPAALFLPSCLLYDESLLAGEDGNPGSGGDGSGGEQGSTGGSAPGSGGEITGSGGKSPSGGAGTGGEIGSGGSPSDCDARGTTGAFDSLGTSTTFPNAVSSTTLIDTFNGFDNGLEPGTTYDGNWVLSREVPASSMTPNDPLAWTYEQDPCLPSDDTSMHLVGQIDGEVWGASYDAALLASAGTVSVAGFDGVVFWARSSASKNQSLRIDFTDDVGSKPSSTMTTVPKDGKWRPFQIPFPTALDKTKLKIVHVSLPPTDELDLWLDDLSFYVLAP